MLLLYVDLVKFYVQIFWKVTREDFFERSLEKTSLYYHFLVYLKSVLLRMIFEYNKKLTEK